MLSKTSKTPASSRPPEPTGGRAVVDAVHGTIRPSPLEWTVIDTATFQRLRHLKQLGLGQHVYPNATHTRFAHSLGVLAIMRRVAEIAEVELKLSKEEQESLRLAGLLHDIGHYPYSHLMEYVDNVRLIEERLAGAIELSPNPYPKHGEVGSLIITSQRDIVDALGQDRAEQVARLITGKADAEKLVRLITSTLDMDRIDYLRRDAMAAGVPYGQIDINYLLHNLRTSKKGTVGINHKALAAAEQFCFARYFMYKAVYYHKTTYGLEEALRQLLRRCRDLDGKHDVPQHGEDIRRIVCDRDELLKFTDSYLDRVAQRALSDNDLVIRSLSESVVYRRPPRLLKEVVVLLNDAQSAQQERGSYDAFLKTCRDRIANLAKRHNKPLGLFLLTELPEPLRLEIHGPVMDFERARDLRADKERELVRVFLPGEEEPTPLVKIPHSLMHFCGGLSCIIARLYVVENEPTEVDKMRREVENW